MQRLIKIERRHGWLPHPPQKHEANAGPHWPLMTSHKSPPTLSPMIRTAFISISLKTIAITHFASFFLSLSLSLSLPSAHVFQDFLPAAAAPFAAVGEENFWHYHQGTWKYSVRSFYLEKKLWLARRFKE